MIYHMLLQKDDGTYRLCKSKASALASLIRRGYVAIEESEWKRLHAIKRGIPLEGEVQE